MQTYLQIAQIVVSFLLIISILLQGRGVGLGSAFGGENSYFRTKRGVEKTIFFGSIVLAILFLILGVLNILLVH
jgi:preprotein translocase subunit SecG